MKSFVVPSVAILAAGCLLATSAMAAKGQPRYGITASEGRVKLQAGALVREIDLTGGRISTVSIRVDGVEILSGPAREFSVTFDRALPNQRPVGLKPGDSETIEQNATMSGKTDTLDVKGREGKADLQAVKWVDPVTVTGDRADELFGVSKPAVTHPKPGVTRLTIRARAKPGGALSGVSIGIIYEVYEGYPAIRKWIEVSNSGSNWLRISEMLIDDIGLAPEHANTTLLTPEERGACSSVMAFGAPDRSNGILAVSEVPSAPRMIDKKSGAMGYADANFEWVLGPSETFTSEPVFHFAYSGKVEKTISGVSTPMDRAIEGPYQRFLKQHVGVRANSGNLHVPLWCSWSNFLADVNDANMREQADIAAKAGFAALQIDAGWGHTLTKQSWAIGSTDPDTGKFPNFDATCRYITSKGLKLGLWVSCFRYPDSNDVKATHGQILPRIARDHSVAMSFASSWRDYYAKDMVRLHDSLGVSYVKQDLTAISQGDIAEGHDSRTKKESLLRGLRGLLEAQDTVARLAPDMCTELTHEIYWGTPGVPCDVAALKHACVFHIPPNDYSGCGNRGQRPNDKWTYDPDKLRSDLIAGCWNARQRFFAHRGLPLYGLEYYGAATLNFKGSLTPEVQDRQVCSWLMGAPSVFAGDLASLTQENIGRYRSRFDMLKRLQESYGIYVHFQYSGVPEPTETDWHWWGKLNEEGNGAVVVIRGSGGADTRAINIPWVVPNRKYRVTALLSGRPMGVHLGSRLKQGALELKLPVYGQEILELAPL